jgi:basic amino acid/polyamine antiporter, APA family
VFAVTEVQPVESTAELGQDGGLFVRKSSGLVRELGWRDALSMSLGGGNPAYSLLGFTAFFAYVSNVNLTWPYIIAPFVFIPLCWAYGQLVVTFPRSGGDYVYLSRIFHPAAGAAIGFGFLILMFQNIGSSSVAFGTLGLPEFFRVAALTFHSSTLAHLSVSLQTNQFTQFVAATISLVIIYGIALLGARAITRTTLWCYAAGVVGVILLVITAFGHNQHDLALAYNHATTPGAYDHVIAAAHKAGVATGSTFGGFIKFLPYAAIGYYAWTMGNFPAGELKRGGRMYPYTTMGGLAATAVMLLAGWVSIRHIAGQEFFQSAAGLGAADPTTLDKITAGHATNVALYYPDLVAGNIPALLISGGIALAFCVFVLVTTLVVSRLIFALAFDRLLPSSLADVSERTHVPTKALLVGFAGGMVLLYLTVYSSSFTHAVRNATLIWSIVLLCGSLAVIVLPWRRRDLWAAAPKVINKDIGGIPVIVILGGISLVVEAVLVYVSATNTGISGGYDAVSIATIACTLLIGSVFYVVSRSWLKTRGVDIDLAIHELPPE